MSHRRVRVELNRLKCIEASDEIGFFENDEPYVVFAGRSPNGEVKGKSHVGSLDEGEQLISGKKPFKVWEGDLESGQRFEVSLIWMEEDAGGKDAEKIIKAILSKVGVQNVPFVDVATEFIANDVFGRGKDDYLGSAVLTVENVGGAIRKRTRALKKTKVSGTSKSGFTLFLWSDYWAAADNRVAYQIGLVVRDVTEGVDTPLKWTKSASQAAV